MSAPIDPVLARLEHVHQQGRGWTARCPAHNDKGPSLSIAIGTDGRVLLHCFAGCTVHDITAAMGLTLADLFDRPDWKTENHSVRQQRSREADWAAALNVLAVEATIVDIAANQLATFSLQECNALAPEDHERLILAIQRISDARKVLNDR